MNNNNEISYEIQKCFGVIDISHNNWRKELNLVSWNDNPAKFDIRDWDKCHRKMSRGITLTELQAKKLFEILKSIFESDE